MKLSLPSGRQSGGRLALSREPAPYRRPRSRFARGRTGRRSGASRACASAAGPARWVRSATRPRSFPRPSREPHELGRGRPILERSARRTTADRRRAFRHRRRPDQTGPPPVARRADGPAKRPRRAIADCAGHSGADHRPRRAFRRSSTWFFRASRSRQTRAWPRRDAERPPERLVEAALRYQSASSLPSGPKLDSHTGPCPIV